jgi:hypothetical protein
MYHMNSNVFSIDSNVVVSENFTRLNNWLRANGFVVEEILMQKFLSKKDYCVVLPYL